ncbi:MAG: glucose-6-phosphate isomerase [Thermotogaceae bacterium]|jgi:glucose-6-phosphate isomerase|nr:glucose-6-phosphate isomerase [Thermotogaceae bacterium]MDN5337796.1 glucose-6-phosphate isomerase [Thermotogaceae bacterium]
MLEKIRFDFSFVFSPNISDGLTEDEINSYSEKITRIIDEIEADAPGFLEVPFDKRNIDSVKELAAKYRYFKDYDDFVVLGIGGSALGNIALRDSLNGLDWNRLSRDGRKGFPRIHVVDNVDPDFVSSILKNLDMKKTIFNVISKSGSTAEAMANYMVVRGIIESLGLDVRKHLIITTDPENGVLRKIASEENIDSLEIPPRVGGRFSVLTPVGLLSAIAGGLNIDALIDGAKNAYSLLKERNIWKNPAALNALVHYLYYTRGKNISVMMSYSNRLYSLADWYRQLWAESLGKKYDINGNEVNVGQTPVKALGATDQHSQIQLYNEGPNDKIVTFLVVRKFDNTVKIPKIHEDIDSLAYLGGKSLNELLSSEQRATAYSLAQNNRPNLNVEFSEICEESIGEFIFTYELQTAIMGKLLNINAFDQPGVEMGKKLTYSLMGRKGYSQFKEILEKSIKKYIV